MSDANDNARSIGYRKSNCAVTYVVAHATFDYRNDRLVVTRSSGRRTIRILYAPILMTRVLFPTKNVILRLINIKRF